MANSMTGFARAQGENEHLVIVWECRSVNHRYLDINFRIPEQIRPLENALRERIGKQLKRGKVDCVLKYEIKSSSSLDLNLNVERVQQLFHLQGQLTQHHSSIKCLSVSEILNFPGVLDESKPEEGTLQNLALQVLDDALIALNEARAAEGARVISFIQQRSDSVKQHVDALRTLLPEIRKYLRNRVTSKLSELEQKPDQERLEQELVFYAQRLDVDEELDRLDSHLAELNKTLKQNKPIGRRLDFLMQEFNREANTLASKSQNATSTQHAVELKVLIEQMREQIQNVE